MPVVTNLFPILHERSPLFRGQTEDVPPGAVMWRGRWYTFAKESGGEEVLWDADVAAALTDRKLSGALRSAGYRTFGRIGRFAWRQADILNDRDRDVFELYRGFRFQVIVALGDLAVRLEPKLLLRTTSSLAKLADLRVDVEQYVGSIVSVLDGGERKEALLQEVDRGAASVRVTETQQVLRVQTTDVFPENRADAVEHVLSVLGRRKQAIALVQKNVWLDAAEPSKERLRKTLELAAGLATEVFPITLGYSRARLATQPVAVVNEVPR